MTKKRTTVPVPHAEPDDHLDTGSPVDNPSNRVDAPPVHEPANQVTLPDEHESPAIDPQNAVVK